MINKFKNGNDLTNTLPILFVRLYIFGLYSCSRFYGDFTITGEGLQIKWLFLLILYACVTYLHVPCFISIRSWEKKRNRMSQCSYTRYSSLLSSEGCLACHTYMYCDTGHMVIYMDLWHSQLLATLSSETVTIFFLTT